MGLLTPRRLLIIALALLVVVLLVSISSCVGSCTSTQSATGTTEQNTEQPALQPAFDRNQVSLPASLDADVAEALLVAAEQNSEVAWIATHVDAYAQDGTAVQAKLLKLAALEPESVPFVRGFPEHYPSDTAEPLSDEPRQGGAPLLYQWDARWANTVYSSTTFALTGCCPTSLSMVYQGLTGKSDLSPFDMGVRAREGGYETTYDGTDSAFLINEAASLGLSCSSLSVDASALKAALAEGSLVICNVGPGDFTTAGHFFVISGVRDDGTLLVNDPFSAERSAAAWDVNRVLGQTKALFAYKRA